MSDIVDLENAKVMVQVAFNVNPFCVDNYKSLLLEVWRLQGLILTPEQAAIFMAKCAKPETITRARRQLVHDGKLPTEPDVAERRKAKAEAYRKYYHKAKDAHN